MKLSIGAILCIIIVFGMSVKGSSIMKSAQIEKTRQTIQQLVEWYAKKEQFFKAYVPIQQSLIKKVLAAPEITLGRLKEIAQIVAEEKELQAFFFQKTEKAILAEEARFMPRTEEKADPKDPKGAAKIKTELPTWSNNIDRVILSMSRSFKDRRARIKLVYKTLEGIQGELGKEQQRYKGELKKEEKDLQRLFQKLDEHEKESSKILGKIIKESKGENIKDSAFFISQIKAIQKNLHGEYDCFAERGQILLKLIQAIIKNQKAASHKVKEQLTAFLNYRREHGKESKADQQVWGFLSITEERVQQERLRYFNAILLKPERVQQLKAILQKAQFKSNWQVIVRFLQMSKQQLMRAIGAKQQITRLMKSISYRCWQGISLAQGWLIQSYTPAVLYMTYDYIMIIYNLNGDLLKKISTNCSKVKKTEGQTLFLQEKLKGFFSDSIEEYKLKFQDPERMEEFQLFIENQVK